MSPECQPSGEVELPVVGQPFVTRATAARASQVDPSNHDCVADAETRFPLSS